MSLSSRPNVKFLRALDPTIAGSFPKVQNVVLFCCGLVVAFQFLLFCWRWAAYFDHRGRLCDHVVDSRDSAHKELNASVATTPLDAPYGLQILYAGLPNATVDVVAVHGLGANPKYAWVWKPQKNPPVSHAHSGKPVNWLVDLLPQVIPHSCRVMTFNYDSNWIFDAPQQRLSTISDELLVRLRNKREDTVGRPLIFVGHSFGGNVIEQAIVTATRSGSEHSDVAESTVGVIFLGTPHRGSPAAKWGALIASNAWMLGAVTEDRIVKELEEQSATLTDRLDDFSKWLFSYSVVPESSARIDGHTSVGLATDHFKINKFYGLRDPSFEIVSSEIVRMANGAEEMLRRRRSPQDIPTDHMATSGELKKCLQKMLLTDPRDDLDRIQRQKERRVGHTCEWLLKREEFSNWGAKSDSHLLRLIGSPGIGKTMMSIFLVNELQRKVERTPNTAFAYYFCDNKDKVRNTPTAILRSIIRQLLLQRHALFEHIQSDFNEQKSNLFENFYALWRILESMLRDQRAGEVFVLVDALDECALSTRNDLLRSIEEFFDSPPTGWTGRVKFLITCRPNIDDIEDALNGVGTTLDVDSGEINSDLSEYINIKVDDLAEKRGYAPDLKNEVRDALRREARGTFLWASLMLADLKETPRYEVRKRLRTLPRGLDDTYVRILAQVPEGRREDARFLLLCMVAAQRPLKKKEIAAAFGTWVNDLMPPCHDLDRYADLCSACSSIIYLDNAGDDEGTTVNFLHQSVKDFLLRDRSGADVQWYHTSSDRANLLMFQVCWKYLSMKEFGYGKLIMHRTANGEMYQLHHAHFWDLRPHFGRYFFLEYASKEWKVHAILSYPAVLDRFQIDLQTASTLRDAWLLRTAQQGQGEVLKQLLRGGAEPAVRDGEGRTPLSWAAGEGHKAVVKLLLEKEADVESRSSIGRTPLSWAAGEGHEAMVKLLLDMGADVESKDAEYSQTPLSWAAKNGHEAVLMLLIEKGADVESKDIEYGRTPLWWATKTGHEAVVKLLLENGADLETKDTTQSQTPLLLAAANGHKAVVELLLEKRANMESKDAALGKTPLSRAAQKGHEAVVKLLLEKGADVESKDIEYGRTPLWWATKTGHEAVVKLLLENGADFESRDTEYGRTPLRLAAGEGHEAVVKLLLEKEADFESRDTEYGRTPLLWAARNGHKAVVKLLLEKGADFESRDIEYGRTPLSWAARNGHKAVVKLLLEKGADFESQDTEYGRTPLSWATWNGNMAVVELLLEKGAHVKSQDTKYGRSRCLGQTRTGTMR